MPPENLRSSFSSLTLLEGLGCAGKMSISASSASQALLTPLYSNYFMISFRTGLMMASLSFDAAHLSFTEFESAPFTFC